MKQTKKNQGKELKTTLKDLEKNVKLDNVEMGLLIDSIQENINFFYKVLNFDTLRKDKKKYDEYLVHITRLVRLKEKIQLEYDSLFSKGE